MENKISEKNKSMFRKFRRWMVIQKVTLARGYMWLQIPFMGFLAASQLKLLFPAFFKGIFIYAMLILFCTFMLWLVGYIDKKMRFLHEETDYNTEVNTLLMELVNANRKNEK